MITQVGTGALVKLLVRFGVVFTALAATSCLATHAAPPSVYQQSHLPIAERVSDLLKRMTLEEKVNQLLHPWGNLSPEQVIAKYGNTSLGAMYVFWVMPEGQKSVEAQVKARNDIQRYMMEHSRLGIPISFVQETLHGGGKNGTVFPMPINMGASWNKTLVGMIQTRIAISGRAHGADRAFAPVINLMTDPRFGRQQEGFSEDPLLTSAMALAAVGHLQGNSGKGAQSYLPSFNNSMLATVKHFAAYGMTSGGIDGSPADMSVGRLRDVYLLPWHMLARAGELRSVMAAQNMVNGVPMHANHHLLTQVLRQEWGVEQALVESDGGDCIEALLGFQVVGSNQEAAEVAVRAGMDMDLGAGSLGLLVQSVQQGRVKESVVDAACGHVLNSKFAAGLFDQPYTDPLRLKQLDNPANRQLAREAAQQGIVLLKNDHGVLPFDVNKGLGKVAVVGPLASSSADQLGGYTAYGARIVTPLAAIRAGAGDSFLGYSVGAFTNNFSTAHVADAVKLAAEADVIIAVLGDSLTTCGEMWDRASLDLPGGQLPLLEALVPLGKTLIVVLIHGRAATFGAANGNTVLEGVDALLSAWRPGEEGGSAVWDILSGAVNPSGKNPVTWPRSAGHVGGPGMVTGYMYPAQGDHFRENYVFEQWTPLFPFGFGLSYSNLYLSDLSVTPQVVNPNTTLHISVLVHNGSPRPGATVVQIYFQDVVSSIVRVSRIQLAAFQKLMVPASGASRVTLELPMEQLAMYDSARHAFVLEAGEFRLYAGTQGMIGIEKEGLQASVSVATTSYLHRSTAQY